MRYAFEVLDDFEVVWDGGELLPARETKSDGRWDDVPMIGYGKKESAEPPPPKKRQYNKTKLDFWSKRIRLSDMQATDDGSKGPIGWRANPPAVRYRPPSEESEGAPSDNS
jgi:hypothetical protein